MATPQGRPERFLAYSTAGPQRDLARDAREQPWWDDHAAFIDGLVAEGFIQLGGPLDEERGGFLVVMGGRGRGAGTVVARSVVRARYPLPGLGETLAHLHRHVGGYVGRVADGARADRAAAATTDRWPPARA